MSIGFVDHEQMIHIWDAATGEDRGVRAMQKGGHELETGQDFASMGVPAR